MKNVGRNEKLKQNGRKLFSQTTILHDTSHIASSGTLHGGCVTALVDVSTTMAGVALRGATGMSTNMHVNFIAPVKVGETVRMDSVITKSGKALVYARSDLFLKEGNKPVATALHTLIYPNNNR